ncbi:ROK family protein [Enterococcus sp. LJL120]
MYLGIDLGGTAIKLGLFDQELVCIDQQTAATDSLAGATIVLKNLVTAIKKILRDNQLTTNQVQGIGLGVPGLLDLENGISLFSPNFTDWENIPIVAILEKEFDIPTVIDNDVRMNLFGEWTLGAAQELSDFVFITLGTGLGAGVVINQQLLYGASNSFGEIGHMNMYREGRPCACGSSGCLGRYVSARGMVKTAVDYLAEGQSSILSDWLEEDRQQLTAKMISEGVDQGDALCQKVFQETGEIFGFGLVNVINLYNPKKILIGGGMAKAGERLLAPARQVIQKHALKISAAACQLELAALGSAAGMIGAASVAAKKFG